MTDARDRKGGTLSRLAGKGLYPPRLAWMLLLPLRNLWLSPATLARRMGLAEDWTVLEVGCGPGYFGPAIARRLPRGRLFLADIQPEMVEKARRRLARRRIANAEVKRCDASGLPFRDGQFDAVYLVTVLGEIGDPALFAREMARVLKPGGKVSISEQWGDPDALRVDEVDALLSPAGLRRTEVFGKGRTFTANYRRP